VFGQMNFTMMALNVLKLLVRFLKEISQGRLVSIVPSATEMTTQAAADLLGCSRTHLVKLLDSGEIPFVKVGRHRIIKYEDLMGYKQKMKKQQETLLVEMMEGDEEAGLYDL
jgi:excisionase family DNA binding protein